MIDGVLKLFYVVQEEEDSQQMFIYTINTNNENQTVQFEQTGAFYLQGVTMESNQTDRLVANSQVIVTGCD